MKIFGILFLSLLIARSVIETGNADETVGEKIETSTNNVKRSVKRAAHQADESLCKKDSSECLGKQLKKRATELKDATVDGIKDLKNKAD